MSGPREECGVFGMYGKSSCSTTVFNGISSLQHRGQESCGIAMSNKGDIDLIKGMGLVSKVFDEDNVKELKGNIGISHVRYSTAGESKIQNAQPFVTKGAKITFAMAHNGNLVNV